MKTSIQLAFLCCFMTMFTMDACSLITGDKCDGTIMEDPDEPVFSLHITQVEVNPDNFHLLSNANQVKYHGRIFKVYCGGKESGGFDFAQTFSLKDYTPMYFIYNGVYLDQPYQFKFDNDEDYVQVEAFATAYFNDRPFQTNKVIKKFYYEDIKFDVNRFERVIYLYLPEAGTTWSPV